MKYNIKLTSLLYYISVNKGGSLDCCLFMVMPVCAVRCRGFWERQTLKMSETPFKVPVWTTGSPREQLIIFCFLCTAREKKKACSGVWTTYHSHNHDWLYCKNKLSVFEPWNLINIMIKPNNQSLSAMTYFMFLLMYFAAMVTQL